MTEARSDPTAESNRSSTDAADIAVSRHADFRWVQRARAFETAPTTAWRRARPVVLEGHSTRIGRACDAVRYDSRTETLLCVRDHTLTTVLRACYESFRLVEDTRDRSATDADDAAPAPTCAVCGRPRGTTTERCRRCGHRAVLGDHTEQRHQHGGSLQ